MIKTIKYCDICGKQTETLLDMSLVKPYAFTRDKNNDFKIEDLGEEPPTFGEYSVGDWDLGLCPTCMVRVWRHLKEEHSRFLMVRAYSKSEGKE